MDFFTVPTLTGRVLFVVVMLSHHRRRILHFNTTAHLTAEWSAQQVVEAFPDDTAPGQKAHRFWHGLSSSIQTCRLLPVLTAMPLGRGAEFITPRRPKT
jgi:hypothetical protein